MHGLECTCCSESFIRSAHPLVKDVVLSMISLDYDDTIMAAAGHQAYAILKETRETYKGKYVLAVEGNPPLNEDGMYCIDGGRPFVEKLKEMAEDAFAVIAWGCVQAAKPNSTHAVPIDKVITNKPIIKAPGCPPIADVMTGVRGCVSSACAICADSATPKPRLAAVSEQNFEKLRRVTPCLRMTS